MEVLNAINQRVSPCLKERNVKWRYSLVSSDRTKVIRTKVIAELNVPDIESLQEVQHKVGISFDRVWSAEFLSD